MRRRGASVLVLALACMLVAGGVPAAAERHAEPPDRELIAELRGRGARLAHHAATGQVRFIGGTRQRPIAGRRVLGQPATAAAAADRFMARYGSVFGVGRSAAALRQASARSASGGGTFVRYQQLHRGVPVLGGDITVQVTDAGDVVSAIGEASPGLELAVAPQIDAAAGRLAAIEAIARARGVDATDLDASEPALWVYDPALMGGRGLRFARLVWRTEVTHSAGDMRELVLVDAARGNVALHFEQIAHARNRITCDGGGTTAGGPANYPCSVARAERVEGGGSTGIADIDNAHQYTGDTYDFYFQRFGRDSLDGAGMTLASTVRYCDSGQPCPYPNAFWDGTQMVYGAGFAVDDVVGHELTHGVTEFSSGLFYYYQSGAINEALSDIFGEFIDLTNGGASDSAANRWLVGEDLSIGAIRDMEDPSSAGHPARMRDPLYTADSGEGDAGGVHHNSGVANKAAFLMTDGGLFNGQVITGLGLDISAAVWYRAATNHLGSASDYADLGSALNQACTDLIGATPNQGDGTPSPSGAISADHCTEVAEVVLATEMALQPAAAGAAAPEAPLCPTGTPTDVFFDDLENTSSGFWTTQTISGGNVWYYPQTTHPYVGWNPTYATSGNFNLWGDDIELVRDSAIRMSAGVTIPANGMLHFRHAYGFDDDAKRWDGGVLEYQVGSGAWTDASGLPNVNGYNGTIASGAGNPLAGRHGFTAESNGYISSRYNLGSLAGQSVKFRFRIGTDASVYDYGWFIDDIRIYSCATAAGDTTGPTMTAPDVNFRTVPLNSGTKPVNLNASFTAADTSGIIDTTLEQSVNGAAFTDMALATSTSMTRDFKAKPSPTTTRQLRAGAIDGASNSASANAPAFLLLGHQDASASVVQNGTWTTKSSSSFYKGTVRHSGTADASQALTRNGTDFAIVSTLGPNRGKARVFVDGVAMATVDLYRATTTFRQVIFAVSFPTAGDHTIELRVLGMKNAASSGTRVDFDAFLSMGP